MDCRIARRQHRAVRSPSLGSIASQDRIDLGCVAQLAEHPAFFLCAGINGGSNPPTPTTLFLRHRPFRLPSHLARFAFSCKFSYDSTIPMAKIVTDKTQIEWFLTHAVENVFPSRDELRKKLMSGERLTVYNGMDPTGPFLHLGHSIQFRKLAELQALGHRVILLIGDFTAMIGDPTDKKATRKVLTREEVLENCRSYKEQAAKFLDFSGANKAEMRFNSEWLGKMTFGDVIELASHFTVQQMLERDMFEKRMEEKKPIHLHEFFYPLMQGYDSVVLDADLETGGNDQTFNMLAGRTLMREMKHKEKFVLATKLLVDPTGKKMGKSEGNMIMLVDKPEDVYGKVMSWTDGMIVPGFAICTDATEAEVKDIDKKMAKGENPMAFKRALARRIVQMLQGKEAADEAEAHFHKVHQKGERPEEIVVVRVSEQEMLLQDALVAAKLVTSKTEARRQIEQGGIKVNDQQVTDVKGIIKIEKGGTVIQKGKRHFVKFVN